MKAGIALIGAAGHEHFLAVIKAAGQRQPSKLHLRPDIATRQVDGRGSGTALEVGNQLVLPFKALKLPGAKPQQNKKRRKREECRPEKWSELHHLSPVGDSMRWRD